MGSSEGVFAIGSPRGEDNKEKPSTASSPKLESPRHYNNNENDNNEKPSSASSLKLSRLEAMPFLPFANICRYLPSQDLPNLRQASKTINDMVIEYDMTYINPLIHQLSTFTPNEIPADLFHECILRSATDLGFRTRLIASLKYKIQENGFLLDRKGSGLSSLLRNTYNRISFLDFIREDMRADSLFKKLFDCDLPEENRDQFIYQLAACFPVDAIYFSEDAAKNVTLADFYTNHEDSMFKVIEAMRTQSPYFSYGVSDLAKFDDKVAHNIVVSQSHLKDPALNLLLKQKHKHTIIVPIDNAPIGILSLEKNDLPQNIGKLSLVDTQQICTSIRSDFLRGCRNLKFLDISGLSKLKEIGNNFLALCESLEYLDTSGLINVATLGDKFLYECINLKSISTSGLINVVFIGDYFLFQCLDLKFVDLSVLKNLKVINNCFMANCDSLQAFDTRGLDNVVFIGSDFLRGCRNLKFFDSSGLTNVREIRRDFLTGCWKLESINTSRLINLESMQVDSFQLDEEEEDSIKLITIKKKLRGYLEQKRKTAQGNKNTQYF